MLWTETVVKRRLAAWPVNQWCQRCWSVWNTLYVPKYKPTLWHLNFVRFFVVHRLFLEFFLFSFLRSICAFHLFIVHRILAKIIIRRVNNNMKCIIYHAIKSIATFRFFSKLYLFRIYFNLTTDLDEATQSEKPK